MRSLRFLSDCVRSEWGGFGMEGFLKKRETPPLQWIEVYVQNSGVSEKRGVTQNSKVALKVLWAALGLAAAQYTFRHIYLR